MGQAEQQKQETSLWEYLVGGVGVLFLLGIAGFLIYEAMQPTTPPEVIVITEQVLPMAGGYLVKIQATNAGETTGAGVLIEGTLKTSDPQAEPVETSSTTFDYIPPNSRRYGGLFFHEHPDQYILELNAKGYTNP